MFDFLRILIQFFEKYNISYMLSGSIAMSVYTGPRYTRDFDFIVHLKPSDVNLLCKNFAEGYYCDEDAIRDAINNEGMFNIIDFKSNYKADFIILKNNVYRKTEFERREAVDFLDMKVYLVSPEDLIISKLIWIQEIQSSVQAEDIKSLSDLEKLDWHYITGWIDKLNLNTFDLIKK